MAEFVPIVEAEIKKVKEEGLVLKVKDGLAVHANCEKAIFSMTDGKMVTNLLNCAGAYCTMCTKSQKESHQLGTVEKGFMIERSVDSMKEDPTMQHARVSVAYPLQSQI